MAIRTSVRVKSPPGHGAMKSSSIGISEKTISKKSKNTSLPISKIQAAKGWQCGNFDCPHTELTVEPRNKTGRKTISDWFGRNKRQTKGVHDEVWNWYCRKCYQQSRYHATERSGVAQDANAKWTLSLLTDQVERLKIWRPQALFDIQIQVGVQERLNKYYEVLALTKGDHVAAEKAVTVVRKLGNKKQIIIDRSEAATMGHVQYLKRTFCGVSKTYLDIEAAIEWMQSEVAASRMLILAPFEFIMHRQRDDEPFTDPNENAERFMAKRSGVSYEDLIAARGLCSLGSDALPTPVIRDSPDALPLYRPPQQIVRAITWREAEESKIGDTNKPMP